MDYKKILNYYHQFFPEIEIYELERIFDFMNSDWRQELTSSYENYECDIDFDINSVTDFSLLPILTKYIQDDDNNYERKLNLVYALPIVNKVLRENRDLLTDKDNIFSGNAISNIIDTAVEMTCNILYRTIISENAYKLNLHTERIEKSRELIFEDYINATLHGSNTVSDFCMEYQALVKYSIKRLGLLLNYVREIKANLVKDSLMLEKSIGIRIEENCISKLSIGHGDTHCNGKSVTCLKSKDDVTFFYKPHDMDVDVKFYKLLDILHQTANLWAFNTPKIFVGEGYGCVAKVDEKSCKTEKEVKCYYRRCGELLAVFYSINTVDIHFENIIASGEYPVVIDLETLFNPKLVSPVIDNKSSALIKAVDAYSVSVMSIGMLPLYMESGVEVGGLGGDAVQITQSRVDKCVVNKEDGILIKKITTEIEPENNIPIFNGVKVKTVDYISELLLGFDKTYRWIIGHKEEYFNNVKSLFSNVSCRLIIKSTRQYGRLLGTSLHQEFSRKPFERDIILYRNLIDQYENYPTISRREFEDLRQGDIPYFTFKINSNKIYDSNNNEMSGAEIEDVFGYVKAKIESFSLEDLKRQEEYIQASFISKRNITDYTGLEFIEYDNKLEPDKWVETAKEIGDFLIEKMIIGVNDSGNADGVWNCVTLQGLEEDTWVPTVLSNEMYSGNTGIGLFFLVLWEFTGEDKYFDALMKTIELPIRQLDELDTQPVLGAFTGHAGTLYLLNEITTIYEDEQYRTLAIEKLQELVDSIPTDKMLDLIGGVTGLLGVTLKLASRHENNQNFTKEILAMLNHLRNSAKRTENGDVYWNVAFDKNYSGFAHGNAGIHTFIYLATEFLDSDCYNDLIQDSMKRERTHYNHKQRNWKKSFYDEKYSNAWCHGSTGILLSKLLLKEHGFSDEYIDDEIRCALENTINNGFGNNPTFCHGDLGSLEVIYKAGKVLNRPDLCEKEMHCFQKLYEDVIKDNWNGTGYRSCYTYGLMVGLAGWGYSLLSHYANHKVPQFLWLG